jgi:hypothetical protein
MIWTPIGYTHEWTRTAAGGGGLPGDLVPLGIIEPGPEAYNGWKFYPPGYAGSMAAQKTPFGTGDNVIANPRDVALDVTWAGPAGIASITLVPFTRPYYPIADVWTPLAGVPVARGVWTSIGNCYGLWTYIAHSADGAAADGTYRFFVREHQAVP